MASQEDFDASAKKVARRRILRAEHLRLKTSAATIEACGKHPGIVEDDEVTGTEKVGEVAELKVLEHAACGRKVEKARCRAVGQRLLGD